MEKITVKVTVSKTRSKRKVVYQPTLKAWLEAYPISEEGLLPSQYHARLRKLRQEAGIIRGFYENGEIPPCTKQGEMEFDSDPVEADYGRSIMRHTFGSHLYRLTDSEEQTLMQMGHTNPRTFFEHYYEMTSEEKTKDFWTIYPLSVQDLVNWVIRNKIEPVSIGDGPLSAMAA